MGIKMMLLGIAVILAGIALSISNINIFWWNDLIEMNSKTMSEHEHFTSC